MISTFKKEGGEQVDSEAQTMNTFQKTSIPALALIAVALAVVPKAAFAQTDEIQVYDAEIEDQGKFKSMVHNNFTPIGRKTPDFPGGIIPNHSDNGAVEWAYGVADWFEQGLYFPVYTAYSEGRGGSLNGFKIRELFVRPHAHDHTFFYGVNFEFSVNYKYWESRRITSEVRPIVGLHLHPVDIIFNPIVDTEYTGGFGDLEFVPATRIAYNVNDKWAVAVEEYSDDGPLRHFLPVQRSVPRGLGRHGSRQQDPEYRNRHRFWRDRRGRQIDVEADAVARSQLNSRHILCLCFRGIYDGSLVI